MSSLRRGRGILLRLVRRRAASLIAGILLVAPGAWIRWGIDDLRWWHEGLALVLAATGAALIWSGIAGTRPDWDEPSGRHVQ